MRVLALLCVVQCVICGGNAASHSLKYISTAVTGDTDSLDFTIMGLVDDEQFVHYDSNSRRMIPKTEWMEESVDKQYWDKQTQKALYADQIFRNNTGIAMQHHKSTQGQHILEWTVGCVWDNKTRTTEGIDRYVYDRKLFFPDAIKNWSFIPPAQQLFISAVKWNPAALENYSQTQNCIESLKKYVSYRRSTLERTVAPEVSLLQDFSSPVVTCHVTGFYPRDIMVTWQRNGEDLDVDVEPGETVPNEDGTFQTTSNLTVKPEDWKSQNYTCTVQHKSLKQDIILPVKEENIKSNTDIKTHSFMGVIIGCVVGALILILALILALAVIGVVMWRKRSSGYVKTITSDPESQNSKNMQLQSLIQQTPDQPAATDTNQPAGTDSDSGNSTQPAATDTDSVNTNQPEATDTDSGNFDRPAATDTDSGNSNKPAATDTNKPAATDTNQPAATDTGSVNSNRPAATDTNQPAATDTGSVNSNQPAATDTDSVNSNQTAATDTDSVNSNQPAVSTSQAFPAAIGVPASQGVLATKKQINVPYEHKTGS